ncbi:unnamed protein product [Hermetia illucens]|uniref:Uncharacterized protein n=1 Tax=Hermetia illucens TaxID=343691 RepID=A0A7R8UXH3_HERIL|nr:unnamed protein product [Hermetia illucens]
MSEKMKSTVPSRIPISSRPPTPSGSHLKISASSSRSAPMQTSFSQSPRNKDDTTEMVVPIAPKRISKAPIAKVMSSAFNRMESSIKNEFRMCAIEKMKELKRDIIRDIRKDLIENLYQLHMKDERGTSTATSADANEKSQEPDIILIQSRRTIKSSKKSSEVTRFQELKLREALLDAIVDSL